MGKKHPSVIQVLSSSFSLEQCAHILTCWHLWSSSPKPASSPPPGICPTGLIEPKCTNPHVSLTTFILVVSNPVLACQNHSKPPQHLSCRIFLPGYLSSTSLKPCMRYVVIKKLRRWRGGSVLTSYVAIRRCTTSLVLTMQTLWFKCLQIVNYLSILVLKANLLVYNLVLPLKW